MGFWDTLNSALGYKPPKDSIDSLWTQLYQTTINAQATPLIEGIQPESLEPLQNFPNPTTRSVSEIRSIDQYKEKPFTEIIVNPFTFLPRYGFDVLIPPNILSNYDIYDQSFVGTFVNTVSMWRTLPVRTPGNFLKLEILPSRLNYASGDSADATPDISPRQSFADQTFEQGPQTYTPALGDPLPAVTGLVGDARCGMFDVLIQLEDSGTAPIKMRHNDILKASFNTLFVTFRCNSPRFRLLIGNNAIVFGSPDNVVRSQNLHMGPGFGLWDGNTQHPVPFSIDSGGQRNISAFTGTAIGGGSTATSIVFDQTPNTQDTGIDRIGNGGIALFWITGFNISLTGAPPTNFAYSIDIKQNPGSVIRRLFKKTINNASGSLTDDQKFSVPIRGMMHNSQQLVINFNNGGNANTAIWNIQGYSWGAPRIWKTQDANAPKIPMYLPMISENPFPLDYGGFRNTFNSTAIPEFA